MLHPHSDASFQLFFHWNFFYSPTFFSNSVCPSRLPSNFDTGGLMPESSVRTSSQLCVQWYLISSLNSAVVGLFTQQQLAKSKNQPSLSYHNQFLNKHTTATTSKSFLLFTPAYFLYHSFGPFLCTKIKT